MAQLGRALRSGRRGRVFESRHSDFTPILWGFFIFWVLKKLVGFGWDYPVCARLLNLAFRSWIIFSFYAICSFPTEKIQGIRDIWFVSSLRLHQCCQPVHAGAQVRIAADDIHGFKTGGVI